MIGRLAAMSALSVAAVVTAASCGLPGEGKMQQLDENELLGLDQTTTTSSTTSTTDAPTTTLSNLPIETTTTIATEQVTLYFLAGSQLASVSQTLSRPASLQQVMLNLEAGPPSGDVGVGLDSLLEPGLTNRVTEEGGVATADLDGDVFDGIADADQRAAIGQIVLTLTERPGVGQVRFTLDDGVIDLQVPKRGGELSEPGEAVSELDFMQFIDQAEVPPDMPAETVPATSVGAG